MMTKVLHIQKRSRILWRITHNLCLSQYTLGKRKDILKRYFSIFWTCCFKSMLMGKWFRMCLDVTRLQAVWRILKKNKIMVIDSFANRESGALGNSETILGGRPFFSPKIHIKLVIIWAEKWQRSVCLMFFKSLYSLSLGRSLSKILVICNVIYI